MVRDVMTQHADRLPRLLELRHLKLWLPGRDGMVPIITDVSFASSEGEAVGLVGESGSGKSMTARAIARLLPHGAKLGGDVLFRGRAVTELAGRELLAWRQSEVQIIFQDPRAHMNPVRKVGDFLREALCGTQGMGRAEADRVSLSLLERVRVSNARARLDQYPHELSGGLLQRVMIAAALAASPRLLIADEPTTALDVTTQAEVIAILDELQREQQMSLLFITHDLELAAAFCDRTVVMYAGMIVEDQLSLRLHEHPLQPYTRALFGSRPNLDGDVLRLEAIPGRPVAASEVLTGCPFASRCSDYRPQCSSQRPALRPFAGGKVACIRAEEIHGVPANAP
ncbi:MAG: ABC transporter ATP-binding protein [Gemmatimonadota bacterium]